MVNIFAFRGLLAGAAATIALLCTPQHAAAQTYTENFDGVAAPALPTNWTVSGAGAGAGWVTSSVASSSAPNALSIQLPATTSDKQVTWPTLQSNGSAASLTFQRRHDFLETGGGLGCESFILQISINGGPFTDAVAAGGSFPVGGYTHAQHPGCPSAGIAAGQMAWSGVQATFTTTTYTSPALTNGALVRFRFYASSDSSTGSSPIYVDTISATNLAAPAAAVPTLSEWAMILFGVILAGGAALYIQRGRHFA